MTMIEYLISLKYSWTNTAYELSLGFSISLADTLCYVIEFLIPIEAYLLPWFPDNYDLK